MLGREVKITITFVELMAAQDKGFAHHRDYVAFKFKRAGYIITNFNELRYETFQDGDKKFYNIHTNIYGTVGRDLAKING